MHIETRADDLVLVQAIVTQGSLSGAARQLGINHATVFRRLNAIEKKLGVVLFHRARTGYTPTLAGEEAAARARHIEEEILAFERAVIGRDIKPSGTVRVTTTDTLLAGILAPILAAFRIEHPAIDVEIATSNNIYSLTRREADVAIRPSSTPPEALLGRKIASIGQAIYGHRALGLPRQAAFPYPDASWIGPDASMGYPALDQWMTSQGLNARCRVRANTVMGLVALTRAKHGLAVLPCYMADDDSCLMRLGPQIPEPASDLWILVHPSLKTTARIKVFTDFMAGAIRSERSRLAGGGWPLPGGRASHAAINAAAP